MATTWDMTLVVTLATLGAGGAALREEAVGTNTLPVSRSPARQGVRYCSHTSTT